MRTAGQQAGWTAGRPDIRGDANAPQPQLRRIGDKNVYCKNSM